MINKIARTMVVVIILVAGAAQLSAQDVLMNSAETINQGNFKLAFFPTMLFGKGGGDPKWGFASRFGYGFTPGFDIEGKVAFFKGLKYFGADAEFWLVHGPDFNFSVAVGGHLTDVDSGADSAGIDLAMLLSTRPRGFIEFYGGFKIAFDSLKNSDRNRTLPYAVPGVEIRINDSLDFLTEVGIALNDSARSYLSIGLALYFR